VIILQITPEIGAGTGVGAVAHHLEEEWTREGHDVRRFTLADCGGTWLARRDPGLLGRLRHASRVLWFSTVGTVAARRVLRSLPEGTVSICHNDAAAGDVYVNHGLLQVSLKARGHYAYRLVRNPVHLFTVSRDWLRFRSNTHLFVVSLTEREASSLTSLYGKVFPQSVVIGNGVDVARYRPVSSHIRRELRDQLHLPREAVVALFIGHEFHRKGLPAAMESLRHLATDHHLVVVGGTPRMIKAAQREAVMQRVSDRVHFLGHQPDPRPALAAADILVMPSLYEAHPLVLLEAMASGLPAVATPVGSVPELIVDGVNGWMTDGSAEDIARCVREAGACDAGAVSAAARATAEEHSWAEVAERYVRLFDAVVAERMAARPR
jgi:glycosyltransferase involved in cell wall biosynthesis